MTEGRTQGQSLFDELKTETQAPNTGGAPSTPNTPSPSGSNPPATTEEYHDETNYEEVGVSNAYGSDKTKKKPQKQKSKSGGGMTPPKRDKIKTDDKEKDIMEVFWKEFIVSFYEWSLNSAVNLGLDFVDYVLFKSYKGWGDDKPKPEKFENIEKTAFDSERELVEGYNKRNNNFYKYFVETHRDVIENVNRELDGEKTNWDNWPNKKKPRFFDEVFELAKTARDNPDSPEAQRWADFVNSPHKMEQLIKKESLIMRISLHLATAEKAIEGKTFKFPKDVAKKVRDIEKLLDEKSGEPEELKRLMELQVNTFPMTGDRNVDEQIKLYLHTMKSAAVGQEKNPEKLLKGFKKDLENIEKINPLAHEIEERARIHCEKIKENIDRINEKYGIGTEETMEKSLAYLRQLGKGADIALEDAHKYSDPGLSQTASIATGVAQQLVALKDRYILRDGSVTVPEAKEELKQQAKASLVTGIKVIDDFEIGGEKVGDLPAARKKSVSLTDHTQATARRFIGRMFGR